MEDDSEDEIIEQYVFGKLTGEALVAFNQKLLRDEIFRKQVEAEAAIIRNVRSEARQQYKAKLKDVHQRMEAEAMPGASEVDSVPLRTRNIFTNNRFRWLAAASVALLLLCTLIISTFYRPADYNTLFAVNHQPYPMTQIVRGEASTKGEEAAAFVAYGQGKYPQSIALFEQVLARGKNETALFYLGNAYLSAGNPDKAVQTFSQYLREYQEYEVEANWYLALSYLKTGNIQAASETLTPLTKRKNRYRGEATQLLRKLQ